MTTINPYLSFKGNCEEAFNFYKSVFKGEFQFIGRYKDLGKTDRENFSPDLDEKIMHVSLPISKETILMGCDADQTKGEATLSGNNIALSINCDDRKEAVRIFVGLSVGGQVIMKMGDTFWGAYFGMLKDKFGIHWTVSAELTTN